MNEVTVLKLLHDIAGTSGLAKLDICNINKGSNALSLEDIKLLEKQSSSIAESLFAKLLLKGMGADEFSPVALKVWVDSEDVWAIKSGKRLEYEVKVYKKILDEIVVQKYSPNFITYVAYAECKTKDFLSSLKSPDLRERLRSQADNYDGYFNTNGKIHILITERAGNGAQFGLPDIYPVTSLVNWFWTDITEEDAEKVMFQLVYSLEVMQRYRIVHNDFHTSNILVVTFPEEIVMRFNVGAKTFLISTKYVPYLFDWDLSYAESLGPNKGLIDEYESFNIYNRFSKKFDLYTLLCYVGQYSKGKNLAREYDTQITREKEQKMTHYIYPSQYNAIKKYEPFSDSTYKMSGVQLRDILISSRMEELKNSPDEKESKDIADQVEEIAPLTMASIMFKLVIEHVIEARDKQTEKELKYTSLGNEYTGVLNKFETGVWISNRKELFDSLYSVMRIKLSGFTATQKINEILTQNTNAQFRISRIHRLQLYHPYECRMTAIDSTFPTPLEFLDKKEFEKYIGQPDVKTPYVYTMPENPLTKPAIFIYPELQRKGRSKIFGKPTFPPQVSGNPMKHI